MTIYEYIAANNPVQAERTIRRFGYESVRGSNLGDNLREVVAQEGEDAFRAVLDLHPDREVIVEVFAPKEEKESCGCTKGKCTCRKNDYMNADGANNSAQETTAAQVSAAQANTFLMAAALILAVAIIVKK